MEAESGGGMVTVKVNGKQEVMEVNFDQDDMAEEREMLDAEAAAG